MIMKTTSFYPHLHLPRKPLNPIISTRPVHFQFPNCRLSLATMEEEPATVKSGNDQAVLLSKNQQKKLLRQQRYEAKKAERKAREKEHKKQEAERKKREWNEKLSGLTEEERKKVIEERLDMRKERIEKRNEEKENKIERLNRAKEVGQKIVVDLDFSELMAANQINSLVQQIVYCYAVNGRSCNPCHLWLTGYKGELESQFEKIPGFSKWIVEKKTEPYIDALQDQKDKLVYLTADAETLLDELDPKKIYIVGGLVDRNKYKRITLNKANEQGIQAAKLPIGNYLKMSSSQVLTVNQVLEILLKYAETKDWKTSFFHVIPQRKRCESEDTLKPEEEEEEESEDVLKPEEEEGSSADDEHVRKRVCVESSADM